MAEISVTRRYAKALFDIAQREGTAERIETDLETLDALLRATPNLLRVLRAPVIDRERKKALLRTIFADKISGLALRFLFLIVDKRREAILPDINREFRRLSYEHRNIQPVTVRVATRMTAEERAALIQALEARTGKTIEIQEEIAPELIGGAVLRVGDTIIDGSVAGHLRRLRQRLAGSQVIQAV
jgi:F-type H+-transporting ATPase subunit delta